MPTPVATKQGPPRRRGPEGSIFVAVAAEEPRRRGRPARLSRPAILATALRLIDNEGADALTMRRLGGELGVEAMSLYRHVASKRALLDGVAEQMMAEVVSYREAQGDDWVERARSLVIGIGAVARRHPEAFELVGMRALNTEVAIRPIEALLAALRAGGFSPDRAVTVYRHLSAYARGYAMSEIVGFTLNPTRADPTALTAGALPADEFPTIHEVAGWLAREPTTDEFVAGLDTIIAGLQQELGTTRAAA
ncbi:MAG TPA: TetR/AcrR family transcriptional regulator C-terminal domain-containing protein [Solirubrobacteraceae bacterium]|nr:TetR/AcrR family transcriptional regulator C-terminal domain-containing protein [Solirubrobacteraceae bacterium]